MRRNVCILLLSIWVAAPLSFAATAKQAPNDVTGLEWLQMSIGNRMDCVIASMVALTQLGVNFSQSPNDYDNAVEEKLRLDPGLYATNITNLLASIVYEKEPGNQDALNRFRKKPAVKKIEMH